MKKIVFLCLMMLTVSISCKKFENLLRFNIHSSADFTIPANNIIGVLFNIAAPNIPTNSEETFKNEDTRADLVKEVKLKQANITAIDPADQSLSFIRSIKVYISFNDGSNERLIAYKDNVPANTGPYLELDTDQGVILDEYVKQETIRLRTEYVQRSAVTRDVTVRCNMTFNVMADPI